MFDQFRIYPIGNAGPVPKLDPEDFFDDCPVCQAQKQALEAGRNLTQKEFVAACREVSRRGLGVTDVA